MLFSLLGPARAYSRGAMAATPRISGCDALDEAVAILRKQRQHLTEFAVSATSVREEEPPWQFRRIRITYTLTGHALNVELVCRAITLSEEKYCAIYATLRPVVELTSEFVLVEEETSERSEVLPAREQAA